MFTECSVVVVMPKLLCDSTENTGNYTLALIDGRALNCRGDALKMVGFLLPLLA